MPPRDRGRPAKAKCNISGLHNLKPCSPSPEPAPSRVPEPDWPSNLDAARGKSEGEQNLTNADGMKSTAGSESDIGINSDIGVEDGDNVLTHATKSLENEALSVQLLGQVEDMGDHVQVPTRVCHQWQALNWKELSTLQAGPHFVVLTPLPRPVQKTPSLSDGSVMSGIEEQPQDTVDDKA
ncbi:hypothetical protein DFH08DRAFT_808048 [Mycena albidolilacea]|uniref:Uncharacterized protein n=1 Tax=Mycena albidolilacea TaxID=1033008 RepID=A0AAD7ES96_9AGAR|nr:hypothetical protein DFH08DRAFT_808048 [Mycena albidolilacea]